MNTQIAPLLFLLCWVDVVGSVFGWKTEDFVLICGLILLLRGVISLLLSNYTGVPVARQRPPKNSIPWSTEEWLSGLRLVLCFCSGLGFCWL